MPEYRASAPIYLNREGRLIETGEVFTSDETPGLAWIPLGDASHAPAPPAPRKTAPSAR